jgi:hypothetical protein
MGRFWLKGLPNFIGVNDDYAYRCRSPRWRCGCGGIPIRCGYSGSLELLLMTQWQWSWQVGLARRCDAT